MRLPMPLLQKGSCTSNTNYQYYFARVSRVHQQRSLQAYSHHAMMSSAVMALNPVSLAERHLIQLISLHAFLPCTGNRARL